MEPGEDQAAQRCSSLAGRGILFHPCIHVLIYLPVENHKKPPLQELLASSQH